jgi:hypothetical protein
MSPPPKPCVIFVGPTAYGFPLETLSDDSDVRVLPPAQRGDVARLVANEPPAVMAVVDGVFHQSLAVGHAELRRALEKGWQVWGLSSMGAIRAYEMRTLGMRGFGRTYQRFLEEDDFRDDEVAMLHEPAPTYQPWSEPLVHLRLAIQDMAAREIVSAADADEVVRTLENLWFGERTLSLTRRLLVRRAGEARRDAISERLAAIQDYRVKTADLADFLRRRPWTNGR